MAEHGSAGGPNAIQRASFSTYIKDALLKVGVCVCCVCTCVCVQAGVQKHWLFEVACQSRRKAALVPYQQVN